MGERADIPTEVHYKRVRLAELLDAAAEIEHSLCCEYLFAAFTLRKTIDDRPDGVGPEVLPDLTYEQVDLNRRWKATILKVARQEMEHLGLVCNLLTAIGEAPHLTRPEFPMRADYYPADVESKLERFSAAAVLRWIQFEMPQDVGEPYLSSLREWIPGFDSKNYDTLANLYGEIESLFVELASPDALGEEGLFIGPESAQYTTSDIIPVPVRGVSLAGKAVYGFRMPAVTDLASARTVIQQIMEEGEGSQQPVVEGHFESFYSMYQELLAEAEKAAKALQNYQPALPAIDNPRTDRTGWSAEPGSGNPIADQRTNAVSRLFDFAYSTMMLMLMRYFAHTDESESELAALQATVFFPIMTTVIRPLGEVLARLPATTDPAGPTAGPSFGFARRLAFLPHKDAAWKVIHSQLAAAAEAAAEAAKLFPAGDAMGERVAFAHQNLWRMAYNFANAIHPALPAPGEPGQAPPPPPAATLHVEFSGWALLRLPTDPDPTDETRGASGYTFAFGDEPDLDRLIYLQPPAELVRSHSPQMGVRVTKASRMESDPSSGPPTPLDGLVGATIDLKGGPMLENRNWTLTLPGFEPITPFQLAVEAAQLQFTRNAPLGPDDPPAWRATQAELEAHGAAGLIFEPETIGRNTGAWDSLKMVEQRKAALQAELAAMGNAPAGKRQVIESRIEQLDVAISEPTDRRVLARMMVERFFFPMTGPKVAVSGDQHGVLGGELDTTTPWIVSFWLGAWDPDLLAAWMQGYLQIPYKS